MTSFQNAQGFAASPPPAPTGMEEPYRSLKISSENFWAGHTGREQPPAPTYRMIGNRQTLGRYMDPWGCQAILHWSQKTWAEKYKPVLIGMAVFGVVTAFDPVFLFLVVPVVGAFYLWRRQQLSRHYNLYYGAQQHMLSTGQPEWVPYDKIRLRFMKSNPNSVWP